MLGLDSVSRLTSYTWSTCLKKRGPQAFTWKTRFILNGFTTIRAKSIQLNSNRGLLRYATPFKREVIQTLSSLPAETLLRTSALPRDSAGPTLTSKRGGN